MTSINTRSLKKALIEAYRETWRCPLVETTYIVYDKENNKFSEEWSCGYAKKKDDFIVAIIGRPRLDEGEYFSGESLKELVQYFQEEYLDTLVEEVKATVENINNNKNQYEIALFRGESDLYD